MRGLKPKECYGERIALVASFTDAWIETRSCGSNRRRKESHLLQMRGLKQCTYGIYQDRQRVASFTDAWIETH